MINLVITLLAIVWKIASIVSSVESSGYYNTTFKRNNNSILSGYCLCKLL